MALTDIVSRLWRRPADVRPTPDAEDPDHDLVQAQARVAELERRIERMATADEPAS
jgi:hypothetical protein